MCLPGSFTRPTRLPRHAACVSNYQSKPVRPLFLGGGKLANDVGIANRLAIERDPSARLHFNPFAWIPSIAARRRKARPATRAPHLLRGSVQFAAKDIDGFGFAFQRLRAEGNERAEFGDVSLEIAGDDEWLLEFLRDRFETKDRVHRIADDRGVALGGNTDVAARDFAIVEGDGDLK